MTTNYFMTALGTVIASFFGAWLAARFALSRFYRERIWERRAAAYTAIFEALHEMSLWFEKHNEADMRGVELSTTIQKELSDEYMRAKMALQKRLAAETWLIPDVCRLRLSQMLKELNYKGGSWVELLESGTEAIWNAETDLRELVRADLGLFSSLQKANLTLAQWASATKWKRSA